MLIGVSPGLAGRADAVQHVDLHPGRLHYIDISGEGWKLRVVNVHVQELGDITKEGIISSLRRLLNSVFRGICIVMGDFNATIADEGRFAEGKGFHFCSNEGLSKQIDGCFTNFTELHQSDPTHRTTKEGRIVGMGRIDRMYVNLPPHELQDRKIMGGTTHHVHDLSWPSDHAPIWASIAPPMQRMHMVNPMW